VPIVIEDQPAWREPWVPVANEREPGLLAAELLREVAPGHPLHDRPVRIWARRCDCDDVLVLVGNPEQLAVVHLSYASRPDRPPWPKTRIFDSFAEFVEKIMIPDHDEFTSEPDAGTDDREVRR
jgi:hypothetical protein